MKRYLLLLASALTSQLVHAEPLPPTPAKVPLGKKASGDPENNLGVFLGTTKTPDLRPAFTLGLNYEHRLRVPFGLGVGILTNLEFKENKTVVLAPAILFYPTHRLKVFVGGGVSIEDSQVDPVVRIGTGYQIPLDQSAHWTITPTAGIDMRVGAVSLVGGISIGASF